MSTRLAVIGDGKMGRAIVALAPEHGFDVRAPIGRAALLSEGLTPALLGGAAVAVEFTGATAAPGHIRACAAAGVPVVCGTTGWESARADVEADVLAADGALLWAPNFAIGVHLFTRIVREAARGFAGVEGFDAHIVEVHHAEKADAPSGTAKRLRDVAARLLGREPPVTSIRTGQVPGTHTVTFEAPFEHVRLEHVARDRRVFAEGALVAAKWLMGRRGIFTLDDMLGGSS